MNIKAKKKNDLSIYALFNSIYLPLFLGISILLYLNWGRFSILPWHDEFSTLRFRKSEIDFWLFLPQNYPYRPLNGHPPGFQIIIWLLKMVTNDWVTAARLTSFLAATFLLISISKIAYFISSSSASVWILCTIFCASPFFVWISTYMTADVAYAAFGFYGLYSLAARQNKLVASVALSLSIYMRESALAFIVAAFALEFIRCRELKSSSYYFLLAPILVFISHLITIYLRFGVWSAHFYLAESNPRKFTFFHLGPSKLDSLSRAAEYMFQHLHPFIVLTSGLFLLLAFFRKDKRIFPLTSALFTVGAIVFVFFVFYEDILERDFFPAYITIIVFSSVLLGLIIQKLSWTIAVPLACAVYWLSWYKNPDSEIYYRDFNLEIQLTKAASQFLKDAYPDSRILAPWPILNAFNVPFAGYVNKPLNVVSSADSADLLVKTDKETSNFDFANSSIDPEEKGLELVFSRSAEGKFVYIYKIRRD